jgi:hypothetical protein
MCAILFVCTVCNFCRESWVVIGPILFLLYSADMLLLIRRHELIPAWMTPRLSGRAGHPSSLASTRRQHQIPTDPVHIGGASLVLVSSVPNLGVRIDSDVTTWRH